MLCYMQIIYFAKTTGKNTFLFEITLWDNTEV